MKNTERQKTEIIKQIKELESSNQKIANRGLSIKIEGQKPKFFKTFNQFINEVEGLDFTNVYSVQLKVNKFMFLSIDVIVKPFTQKEINKPYKLVKIARNINAFDLNYERIDCSKRNFWAKLNQTLTTKIQSLTEKEMTTLRGLIQDNNRKKHFSL